METEDTVTMTTPGGGAAGASPPPDHPPTTYTTSLPLHTPSSFAPSDPAAAALSGRRATAPYVLLTPSEGEAGGLPLEGATMTRSRSTSALDVGPRRLPARRIIRHTRYIRAASEDSAHAHPLLSTVCAAEERGRRRSVSSTGRAGGSMSVGSSTESLNALLPEWSGGRGRRAGSQDSTASTASTRSLRAVSGRAVKTTIGGTTKPTGSGLTGSGTTGSVGLGMIGSGQGSRRGAKLNPEIRAPWSEGASAADKARKVAVQPTLPTIGTGGSRVSMMRSARVSSGCLERVAPADIPKHLEELERRLGIHATVMAAAVRREVAAEVARDGLSSGHHDDDATSGVLSEAELGHVTSAITGETPTSAATSLTATAILKDVGDLSDILHPSEGVTEITPVLVLPTTTAGGGLSWAGRPATVKVTSQQQGVQEQPVTMETAAEVGRGAPRPPGEQTGEDAVGRNSTSRPGPDQLSLSGRLPPPPTAPGAPPPAPPATTTTTTTTSPSGLLETEINDALPADGRRVAMEEGEEEEEVEIEVEVIHESPGRDGVYVGAPPTGGYANHAGDTRHPSGAPKVDSSLPESVFSAYEDYVRPAGSTLRAEGGQVGPRDRGGAAGSLQRADNMTVGSLPGANSTTTTIPVTMVTDTRDLPPQQGEGAEGVGTPGDTTPTSNTEGEGGKPKLKGILKRPTSEFKKPAAPANSVEKQPAVQAEPAKPVTPTNDKTEEPAKPTNVKENVPVTPVKTVVKDIYTITEPKIIRETSPQPEVKPPEVPTDTHEQPKPEVPTTTPVQEAPVVAKVPPTDAAPIFPTFSDIRAIQSLDPASFDLRMRLTFLDVLINFLLLTPLTVLHYHATCRLLAALFLGVLPRIGAWLLLLTGTGIEFALHFWQRPLAARAPRPEVYSKGDNNLPYVLASKAYNLVLGLGNVCHMLAVCTLVEQYVGTSVEGGVRTTVTAVVVLWALRCGRNVVAPPLYVGIDADDDPEVFTASTMFKVEPDQSAESAADILGTVGVVMSFVHLHWAGLWTVMDAAIFPGTFWLSMLISLLLGSAICILFLLLQQSAMEISRNLEREQKEVHRIAFENVFVIAANVGVVSLWRGLWMAYDFMEDYFPIYCRSWDVTPLAASVLSFLLLALAHCSSCVLFKGCEVDGELKGGQGVRFTTAYFTEILRGHLEDIEDTSISITSNTKENQSPKETSKSVIPITKTTLQSPKSPNGATSTNSSTTEPKQKIA